MMTSSNKNIFRVTGHLCGEFTGHRWTDRWIHRTKVSDAELWSVPEQWLCKQSRRWWFKTQSWSLWRHCNEWYGNVAKTLRINKPESQNVSIFYYLGDRLGITTSLKNYFNYLIITTIYIVFKMFLFLLRTPGSFFKCFLQWSRNYWLSSSDFFFSNIFAAANRDEGMLIVITR